MTPITPELLAEIKRLDALVTHGPIKLPDPLGRSLAQVMADRAAFRELARTALPALARRVEELEAERDAAVTSAKTWMDHSAEVLKRTTAAEQQRDEAVKALEAVDGDLSLLLTAIESGDARGELLTRALFAKRDVERALTPKGTTP